MNRRAGIMIDDKEAKVISSYKRPEVVKSVDYP